MGEPLGLRIHVSVTPSPADLEEARRRLLPESCPRRYCWYWHTLSFDWELSPDEGCEVARRHLDRLLLERRTDRPAPDWPPCRRATDDTGHPDYYEPREPHLEEDGWSADYFLNRGE